MHRELAPQAADVRAHSRVADTKLSRYGPARVPFGHQAQDFLLAWSQALELRFDRAALVEQRGDGARSDQHLASGDVADGGDHLGGSPRLVEKSARP